MIEQKVCSDNTVLTYSKYVVTFRMTSSFSATGLHPGLRSLATISIEYATQVIPNIMVIILSHCMAYYSLFCYQSLPCHKHYLLSFCALSYRWMLCYILYKLTSNAFMA